MLQAIFICCVLPVAIVLIVFVSIMYGDKQRANVLIKAIEANNDIDADKLAQALGRQKKSEREILNTRLLRGCIFTLIGIFLLTVIPLMGMAGGCDFTDDQKSIPAIAGAICLPFGISYLIVYFVSRKQLNSDK